MDQGVVQQADAPLALYQRPANRFVAGFIGSPPMNFIRGNLVDGVFHVNSSCSLSLRERAGVRAEAGTSAMPLPNGPAWLGIRPEDLYAGELQTGEHRFSGAALSLGPVTLEVVEPMGHESLGYFTFAGERCAVRLAPDNGLNAGDTIEPRLRPNSWRLFADTPEGPRLA
jgi:multiple sugar transport system ATP-binding protein